MPAKKRRSRARPRCSRTDRWWGRLATCGRLAIGRLTFVRIFPPNTHILFVPTFRSRRPPHYHYCRPGYLLHMAPAWQPPTESQLSLGNRFRTSIPGQGPCTRHRLYRPALPAHARDREDGDGCHSLSGPTDLSAPFVCRYAEPRSSPDDSTGGSFQGDAIAQKIHCQG